MNIHNVDFARAPAGTDTNGVNGSSKEPLNLTWTFLTNHAHVLVCLARDSNATMRDVAYRVGITERAVQRIVSDLEAGGILRRVRDGRRNQYQVCCEERLRHPIESHRTVGDLLAILTDNPEFTQDKEAVR